MNKIDKDQFKNSSSHSSGEKTNNKYVDTKQNMKYDNVIEERAGE